jgi:RNA polymerase sigma-70 factor (ECF subfamily)
MKPTNDNTIGSLMTDEAIIDLYWKREERAISETDKKYGKYLYTIAYNIVRDRLDCEECLNDTYLGTWNRIPPTRPNVFHVFLSKIMRNIALDRFRHSHAEKRVPPEMIVSLNELDECMLSNPSLEEEYTVRAMAGVINNYLESLNSKRQLIFISRYYYCDQISAIATMLHASEATVYRELATIRQELKKAFKKEGLIK